MFLCNFAVRRPSLSLATWFTMMCYDILRACAVVSSSPLRSAADAASEIGIVIMCLLLSVCLLLLVVVVVVVVVVSRSVLDQSQCSAEADTPRCAFLGNSRMWCFDYYVCIIIIIIFDIYGEFKDVVFEDVHS